jgi:hypothetical protein
MTPAVLRDGKLRSHIVLNANVVLPLAEPNHERIGMALHACA